MIPQSETLPTNFEQWDAAARQVKGVVGFMFTTSHAKYGLLKRGGNAIRDSWSDPD